MSGPEAYIRHPQPSQPSPPHDGAQAREPFHHKLMELWDKVRFSVLDRVTVLEDAVEALRGGSLNEEQRAGAEREAHKLAGSAGMFGFAEGSRLAREVEVGLARDPLSPEDGTRMSAFVVALRRELGGAPTAQDVKSEAQAEGRILVVSTDADLARGLEAEAGVRGMTVETTSSSEQAAQLMGSRRTDAVVLDMGEGPVLNGGLEALELLRDADPDVPVIVTTGADSFADRVEVARRGGRGFLPRPSSAEQAVEAISRTVSPPRGEEMKVLALDDDAIVRSGLQILLEQAGFQLTVLSDPASLWSHLNQLAPDLLLLDYDMPGVNGKELCRVVRNDPRWGELPVVFLTAHVDADRVQEVFAAGADDFVAKPIVGPELAARISNRLERVRLFRRLANTDPLTGLYNRRRSEEAGTRLLTLARRYGQPLSLAIIDLDRFKQVNDRYGHAMGDAVLRRVAGMLKEAFRGEDVIARWGGEEFVVIMYGAPGSDGVRRMNELLSELTAATPPGDTAPHLSFSAGVAEFPAAGEDLHSLYRAADQALYRAKELGRGRVLAAS